VTKFRRKLEAVKFAEFAFVDPDPSPPSDTIKPVLRCAGRCVRLLDFIVLTETMSKHQFEVCYISTILLQILLQR
jgi:hypothetical protein